MYLTLFLFFYFLRKMSCNLPIDQCKVLWVVGAAERLATLGMLSPDIPLRLTTEAVDDFIEIDNYRDILFESDFEIASIFNAVAKSANEREVESDDLRKIVDLILEYKNNRTEIVKYALSHLSV